MYSISRDHLAQMLAAHASGLEDALPEPQDFTLAGRVLAFVEKELSA